MRTGVTALSEREKEALRLLIRGHDAKSIARELGLSVHTVNERLRDARGKLDVSSSREAARLLAEAEPADPNSFADKRLGVGQSADLVNKYGSVDRRQAAGYRLAWLGGGMFIMSLIIAAVALSSAFQGGSPTQTPAASDVSAVPSPAAVISGREWAQLLDNRRWAESWGRAGTIFKSAISEAQWASKIQAVRAPLGAVSSRILLSTTKATSLPGAPDGDYEIAQFQTDFAHKQRAIETVVLAREASGWKVDGYFIR